MSQRVSKDEYEFTRESPLGWAESKGTETLTGVLILSLLLPNFLGPVTSSLRASVSSSEKWGTIIVSPTRSDGGGNGMKQGQSSGRDYIPAAPECDLLFWEVGSLRLL